MLRRAGLWYALIFVRTSTLDVAVRYLIRSGIAKQEAFLPPQLFIIHLSLFIWKNHADRQKEEQAKEDACQGYPARMAEGAYSIVNGLLIIDYSAASA